MKTIEIKIYGGIEMNIDEAVRLAEEERRCYNIECPDYRKYNQCENHSYVLCPQFEDFYERQKQEKENYESEDR